MASSHGDGQAAPWDSSYNAAFPVCENVPYVLDVSNNRPKSPTVLGPDTGTQVLSGLALYEVVKETLCICDSTLSGRSCGGVGGAAPGTVHAPPTKGGTKGGYPA